MSLSPIPFVNLEIINVKKSYQDKEVLKDVSMNVSKGEVIGLLGPNGAGKSTLMKIISGLAKLNGGQILLNGNPISEGGATIKKRIGVIPQENNLERELNVREALYCYSLLFGVENFEERLEQIGKIIDLSSVWDKTVRQLSGGYARRVMIARALLPDPDLLLLDEPSVGLDPDARSQLWALIRQVASEGKGILITTHYMEEAAQLCDRIYFLNHGVVAWQGTPKQLQDDNTTLENLFLNLAREGREL